MSTITYSTVNFYFQNQELHKIRYKVAASYKREGRSHTLQE